MNNKTLINKKDFDNVLNILEEKKQQVTIFIPKSILKMLDKHLEINKLGSRRKYLQNLIIKSTLEKIN